MCSIIFTVISALVIGVCVADDWPADIERCKAGDSDCISKVATNIIQNNPGGLPGIGLPGVEPLHIEKLVVSEGQQGALNLDLIFYGVDVVGLSGLEVKRVVGFESDPSTSKFEFYGEIPKLHIKGKYKANGRILILPIQGEGDCDILFKDVSSSFKFKPNVIDKDGVKHIDVSKIKLLLEPSSAKIQLDNLFNGDKVLGDNMNTFLNENWKDVWGELSAAVNAAVADAIKGHITSVLSRFSYADLYLK